LQLVKVALEATRSWSSDPPDRITSWKAFIASAQAADTVPAATVLVDGVADVSVEDVLVDDGGSTVSPGRSVEEELSDFLSPSPLHAASATSTKPNEQSFVRVVPRIRRANGTEPLI
jgi:hypothetical protein